MLTSWNCFKLNVVFARIASLLRLKKANMRIKKAIRNGDVDLSFGPTSLNLMMIDMCNSRCIMCGHDYHSSGSREMLTLDKVKRLYGHLDMSQIVDINYGGGGEPFLNHDLGKIAVFTRHCCPAVQHTVITNAIKGDPEIYEQLLSSRTHFVVSLNAGGRKTYQTIAGVNAFDGCLINIRKLVAMRSELQSSSDITLSIILMKRNIAELSDFVRLASDLGVNGIKALYVRIYPPEYRKKGDGGTYIGPLDSLFFHQEESDKCVQDAVAVAKELGISFKHEPLFSCSSTTERDCNEPWRSLFVNFDGAVYPCQGSEILFKPKVDSGKYDSGNLLKQHVMEFWNNGFWQVLRRTNAGRNRKEIVPECLCCGNSIYWWGSRSEEAHILDWKEAKGCNLRI